MTIPFGMGDDLIPVVERDEETGRYFAVNYRLHVIAEGATRAEAEAGFGKALSGLVDYCVESGLPLPEAFGASRPQIRG